MQFHELLLQKQKQNWFFLFFFIINQDNQDEIIGDPLFISYNVTFSEEADTNDGLPFLSTNSQNLPIDNLNSQDHTVSSKILQKSAFF